MNDGRKLGFAEFLGDIRGVIVSPARRFAVIDERGIARGSLALLLVPAYFGFAWAGGVYFDRDPFYGYSLIIPALPAAAATFLKLFLIHWTARLFEGRGRYSRGQGRFRRMITVFGYTSVPAIMALILGAALFFLSPAGIGALMRDFRPLFLSIMIAVGIALFIWNLILVILALRTVYAMRDLKIAASFFLGSILAAVPAMPVMSVVAEARVDADFLRPLLAERIVRFYAGDAEPSAGRRATIRIHIDKLAYRFKDPARFDLAAVDPSPAYFTKTGPRGRRVVLGSSSWFTFRREEQIVGRVAGLPGEEVELVAGRLRVNGNPVIEPYLQGVTAAASFPRTELGPSEYLILPEDRTLLDVYPEEWVVPRGRIAGRVVRNRWPIGWLIYRPAAFPEAASPQHP